MTATEREAWEIDVKEVPQKVKILEPEKAEPEKVTK